jgi:hypothetical protein
MSMPLPYLNNTVPLYLTILLDSLILTQIEFTPINLNYPVFILFPDLPFDHPGHNIVPRKLSQITACFHILHMPTLIMIKWTLKPTINWEQQLYIDTPLAYLSLLHLIILISAYPLQVQHYFQCLAHKHQLLNVKLSYAHVNVTKKLFVNSLISRHA